MDTAISEEKLTNIEQIFK